MRVVDILWGFSFWRGSSRLFMVMPLWLFVSSRTLCAPRSNGGRREVAPWAAADDVTLLASKGRTVLFPNRWLVQNVMSSVLKPRMEEEGTVVALCFGVVTSRITGSRTVFLWRIILESTYAAILVHPSVRSTGGMAPTKCSLLHQRGLIRIVADWWHLFQPRLYAQPHSCTCCFQTIMHCCHALLIHAYYEVWIIFTVIITVIHYYSISFLKCCADVVSVISLHLHYCLISSSVK